MRNWLLFTSLALLAGCTTGDGGHVVIALEILGLTGSMADPGTPMTDGDRLSHLDRFPLVLWLSVSSEDLDQPVIETWPELVPPSVPV